MTSQFGVMFFEDPVAAFSNIRRQLKAGGRIAFACWQKADRNTWHPGPALAPFAPGPAPARKGTPPGPFAFGDASRVRGILNSAGFSDVTRTPKSLIVRTEPETIADDSQLIAIPEERRDAARAAMQRHFDPMRLADGRCRFELNIHIFTARNG
jgi:SAM-dependent methyltransferase